MRRSLRRATQALYGALNAAAGRVPLGEALPELHTDGFDAEQIWRQARCPGGGARAAAARRAPRAGTTHI